MLGELREKLSRFGGDLFHLKKFKFPLTESAKFESDRNFAFVSKRAKFVYSVL
jgi:hypothetical protein